MSKYDELKRYDIETDHGDTYEGVVAPDGFYMIADEVYEAIAEIKAENVRLKAENKGIKDENVRLMSRPCYVCKDEQVKALEKKFQELELHHNAARGRNIHRPRDNNPPHCGINTKPKGGHHGMR